MSFAERMLRIDRRIIFLVIGLCTLFPLLFPVGLPIRISSEVRGVYDYIDTLPEGSVFLLSLDFDPASKPELYPQAIAILRHAFHKNLRVVAMTLWVSGTGLADQIVSQTAKEAGKENGKDYVFLGWSPGGSAVILNMGQDLYNAFPADYGNKPTKGLPVLAGVQSLRDVTYAVSLGAGNPGVEAWYVFGKDKYKFELGGGCTGVMAPGLILYCGAGRSMDWSVASEGPRSMKRSSVKKAKLSQEWMPSRLPTSPSLCSWQSVISSTLQCAGNSGGKNRWDRKSYGPSF